MIEVRGLTKRYGHQTVLDDLSFIPSRLWRLRPRRQPPPDDFEDSVAV